MNRQDEIVELVERHGFQTVTQLATRFKVDSSTIRRDLDRLASRGAIIRTRGGAAATAQPTLRRDQQPESTQHSAEKSAIGAAMAERILEGQTVLLDGGTTCLEVAKHLSHSRLTVVTHDLPVGMEIMQHPQINLVFIGGELLPTKTSMWGPTALQQVSNLRVNVAVFGAGTVMYDGIYSTSSYSIELKRKMRSIAGEAFFVADSTKFGREALFRVFGFEDFTAGITDSTLDPIRAAMFPIPLIRAQVGR